MGKAFRRASRHLPIAFSVLLLAACAAAAPPPEVAASGRSTQTAVASSPSAHLTPVAASPTPSGPPLTSVALRDAIQADDVTGHLEELQRVADQNGGNRATGTTGFDASVEYVADRLAAAGYEVTRQTFAVGNVSSINLLVERAGEDSAVTMLGAHLDSVVAGPGINDNGTGVAALLVIAERLTELPAPNRTVRLAFWGAEEGGPHGSRAYVDSLSPVERDRIGAYLNFDMLGSMNPIRFVYAEGGAAPGSEALTALFASYFDAEGLPWAPIDLEGHSDHAAFTDAGIPTGGLFSGGREPKTDAQAATFGGAAGEPADACSDQACDTIDNVNAGMLDEMAAAIAHAVATLAAGD